jgi:glycerol-3-phosphate dehydrogenase
MWSVSYKETYKRLLKYKEPIDRSCFVNGDGSCCAIGLALYGHLSPEARIKKYTSYSNARKLAHTHLHLTSEEIDTLIEYNDGMVTNRRMRVLNWLKARVQEE